MNNHIVTWNPVDRSRHLVLVTRLKRINDTEHFSRVAASGCRVREDEADGLLGINDEDGTDGEGLKVTKVKHTIFS